MEKFIIRRTVFLRAHPYILTTVWTVVSGCVDQQLPWGLRVGPVLWDRIFVDVNSFTYKTVTSLLSTKGSGRSKPEKSEFVN